jgi:predicted TIM-barrel fold metal-dependent hydrolase
METPSVSIAQRIDISAHILPKRYFDAVVATAPSGFYMRKRVSGIPVLTDLDARFRVMDQFEDYAQVLSLALPPIEAVAPPGKSADLARMANEELAAIVGEHPDRFVTAVAGLPLNDVEATLRELEHAVRRLGLRGVQLFTHINGKPLDAPEFSPIFAAAAELDVPIWLHPARGVTPPDYSSEKKSLYEIWHVFGWPFDTTIAMTRMIFGGLFDRYPGLKVITHHLGGTVPFLESRIKNAYDQFGARTEDEDYSTLLRTLKKHPHEYYRMFYADTALYGSPPALECGLAFFSSNHILFGSDMPFDAEGGPRYIRETLSAIAEMRASPQDKQRILHENAVRLLGLKFVGR